MHPIKNAVIQLFGKFYWHDKIQSKVKQDIAETTLSIPGDIKNIASEYKVRIQIWLAMYRKCCLVRTVKVADQN